MKGHVRKRGKKWAAVVYLGVNDKGETKYKWFSGYDSEAEAQRALRQILHDMDTGSYVEPHKMTVRTYFEQWLSDKETEVRYNTWAKYKSMTNVHVLPHLGDIQLMKLGPQHLQKLYTKLLKQEKPLSPRSVLHIHRMISGALDRALKWQLVMRNVAHAVDPPRVEDEEMSVWQPEQVRQFMDAAWDDLYFVAFIIGLTTGMRKAEICGLKWTDVDLERGRIYVRRTLIQKKGKYEFETVKTKKSKRVVSIPGEVVDYLRKERVRQAERRLQSGPYYRDEGMVVASLDGSHARYQTLQRHWLKSIDKAGVPRIRFHDTRHTHASMLFAMGEEIKLISERLGHARTSITMDIYTHIDQSLQDEAASRFGSVLFGNKTRVK